MLNPKRDSEYEGEDLQEEQTRVSNSGVFSQFFDDMAHSENDVFVNAKYDKLGRLLKKPQEKTDFNLQLRQFEIDSEENGAFSAFYPESGIVFDDISAGFPSSMIEEDYSSMRVSDRQKVSINDIFVTHEPNTRKPAKVLLNKYLLGKTIGNGSYGKVKDCLDLVTLRRHAVKIVSKQGVRKIPGGWAQAIYEAQIVRNFAPHCNIVRVVTSFRLSDPDRVCIVMENCLGSIHDLQAAGVQFSNSSISEDLDHVDLDGLHHGTMLDHEFSYQARDPERRLSIQRISTEPNIPKNLDISAIHSTGNQPKQSRIGGLLYCESGRNVVHNELFKNRKVSNIDFTSNRRRDSSPSATQQFRRMPEAQAHAYFLQIFNGISYLHSQGVIHRDIKPGNMLLVSVPGCGLDPIGFNAVKSSCLSDCAWFNFVDSRWSFDDMLTLSRGYLVKLTDFGVSAQLPPDDKSEMVSGCQMTPAIQPPEVAQVTSSLFNGPKLDIYSAGVSLFFMLVGRVPFSSQNVLKMFDLIAKGNYFIPGHVSVHACELIRGMMHLDPEKRFSIRDVARHAWIQEKPRAHPTLRQAIDYCDSFWRKQSSGASSANSCNAAHPSHTNNASYTVSLSSGSSKLPRGSPVWLDPLVYLTRPSPTFAPPHIDETGARIFSRTECAEFYAEEREGPPDVPRSIAPISVIPKLKAYHNIPPSSSSDEEFVTGHPEDLCRSIFPQNFIDSVDGYSPNEVFRPRRVCDSLQIGCDLPGELPRPRTSTGQHSPKPADMLLLADSDQAAPSLVASCTLPKSHGRTGSISAWSKVTCDAPRQRHFSLADTQGKEVVATAAAASQLLHPPDCPDDIPVVDLRDENQYSSLITLNSLSAPQVVQLATHMMEWGSGKLASQSSLNSGGAAWSSSSRPNSRARMHKSANPVSASPRCSFLIGAHEEEEDLELECGRAAYPPSPALSDYGPAKIKKDASNLGPKSSSTMPRGTNKTQMLKEEAMPKKAGRRLTSLFNSVTKRLQKTLSFRRHTTTDLLEECPSEQLDTSHNSPEEIPCTTTQVEELRSDTSNNNNNNNATNRVSFFPQKKVFKIKSMKRSR